MLRPRVDAYIQIRHTCGFACEKDEQYLKGFAAFCDAKGIDWVQAQAAIEWAKLGRSVLARARRLGTVIRFARYLRAEDPRHEVPPTVFGSEQSTRRVPYIFTQEEIARLIQATAQSGRDTLRRHTYSSLFALLACTGLRLCEALHLRYRDLTADGLIIQRSKFRKSRLVPLHPTARAGLERYLERRRSHAPFDDHVFVSLLGKPLSKVVVHLAFRDAVAKVGLPRGPGLPRPTLHSLRHTFTVRSLEACGGERDRITQHMMALSTYLGHCTVANTYWYMQATPQLLNDIAQRCERFVTGELS